MMISTASVSTYTCDDEPLTTCAPRYTVILSIVVICITVVGEQGN